MSSDVTRGISTVPVLFFHLPARLTFHRFWPKSPLRLCILNKCHIYIGIPIIFSLDPSLDNRISFCRNTKYTYLYQTTFERNPIKIKINCCPCPVQSFMF
ncbi:hypothetical protein NP493_509g01007 [Ridgeia piscesae]|uniref:Uncharacterized protein n=1 Tax=Ridgeia piscesae TaxID=27915 RepID=A0AAD9NTT1_RIDPI|nr:hypothetical protein NP493_509g01007 [Ridgeia piscesae]